MSKNLQLEPEQQLPVYFTNDCAEEARRAGVQSVAAYAAAATHLAADMGSPQAINNDTFFILHSTREPLPWHRRSFYIKADTQTAVNLPHPLMNVIGVQVVDWSSRGLSRSLARGFQDPEYYKLDQRRVDRYIACVVGIGAANLLACTQFSEIALPVGACAAGFFAYDSLRDHRKRRHLRETARQAAALMPFHVISQSAKNESGPGRQRG